MKKITGILAFHGSVAEHKEAIKRCGAKAIDVRTNADLKKVDALIIPGGESTTIGKLLAREGLGIEIIKRAKNKKKPMPIYGTCAGAILLAKEITGNENTSLGLIDISVKRNDYGRQVDSFEAKIKIQALKTAINGVFIRAPMIKSAGKEVRVLARHNGKIVMAQQKKILVTTFHPELTDNAIIHRYFLSMI